MRAAAREPTSDRAAALPRGVVLALLAIVVLAAAVRAGGLTRPLVGHYATKNAVYAMVARQWALGEAPWDRPTLDVLQGGQRAWHLLEVPWPAYVAGFGWRHVGGSLDAWGRSVSLICSLGSVVVGAWLAWRWHGPTAAMGTALVLAFSPVAIIFGQCFMLEAAVVFAALGAVGLVDEAARLTAAAANQRAATVDATRGAWRSSAAGALGLWLAAGGVLALLWLLKCYMLVLLAPLAAVAAERLRGGSRSARWGGAAALGLVSFLAAVPAALWIGDVFRVSADPATAGRVYYSLADSAGAHAWGSPLLASGAFYRGLFDTLCGPVLTPLGVGLCLLGLTARGAWRHAAWLLAGAALVLALPRKFDEMLYYHLLLLPPLAFIAGLGWQRLVEHVGPSWRVQSAWVAVAVVIALRYAAGPAYATPEEDRAVIRAAEAARNLAAPGEPIATLHGSTLDLLYYMDRPGWALAAGDPRLVERLNAIRREGGRWLVVAGVEPSAGDGLWSELAARFAERQRGEGWRVYDLTVAAAPAQSSAAAVSSAPSAAGSARRPTTSGMPTAPGTR